MALPKAASRSHGAQGTSPVRKLRMSASPTAISTQCSANTTQHHLRTATITLMAKMFSLSPTQAWAFGRIVAASERATRMSFQQLSLEGKVAVVTGGTSGIGRALSLGLAEAGADVIATARRQQQVDDTATAIEGLGKRTLRLTSDVSDRASLEA